MSKRLPVFTSLFAACALFGCGKNTGLTVDILTPPDSDPFAGAANVVLTLQGDSSAAQQSTAAVMSGKFNASLEIESPSRDNYVYLKVEALDGAGIAVGRGRTPRFVLPDSDTDVTVYIGRPGQVTQTAVRLPDDSGSQAVPMGRKFLAGASLRGKRQSPSDEPSIGALIAGGLSDSAQPLGKAWRYSPILHQLVDAGSPQIPRYGAIMVPSSDTQTGHQAILWGGAKADGTMLSSADKFDPAVSAVDQLWQSPNTDVADAGPPGAFGSTVVEVKDSQFLVSGGMNQAMPMGAQPLAQAILVERIPGASSDMPAKLGVVRLPPSGGNGPMLAPRAEHSATPVTLADGTGALIFGGLSFADRMAMKPAAELFLADKNTFTTMDLAPAPGTPMMPLESRRGHVAGALHSGKVVVIGGYQDDMAGQKTVLGSAALIDPGSRTFTMRDTFLRTPRYGATITVLTQEVLVCGGFDATSVPIANCELFTNDDKLDPIGDPIALPHARGGHLALPLETDQVLLVGGVGDGNKGVAEIDIYTAR